jgi:hypothetical protein
MKRSPRPRTSVALACATAASFFALHSFAATPAEEKSFIESYRKAYEANDTKTLQSFLYTKGSDPMAIDMYKMMIAIGAGQKLTSIELLDLTMEDKKKLEDGTSPDGRPMKMILKPTKKLVLKKITKTTNENSTSSSSTFIAEHEGKLVIPVPAIGK